MLRPSVSYVILLLVACVAVGDCFHVKDIFKIFQQKVGNPQKSQEKIRKSTDECDLCLLETCIPTVTGIPANEFDPVADSKMIIRAVKHAPFSIQKDSLISILTSRSEAQRKEIEKEYKIRYGEDLVKTINEITHMRFKRILRALVTPLPKYYAEVLHTAIEEKERVTMVEIFTTLPPCLVRDIGKQYEDVYHHRLSDDIDSALNELFSRSDYIDVLLVMARGERDDDVEVDTNRAKEDATRMKTALLKDRWELKKKTFQEVFTKRSIPQLAETIRWYEQLRRKDKNFESLETDMDKGMESITEIYKLMVRIVKNQSLYFAGELEKVLYLLEDSDSDDIRRLLYIVRGRCGIDLGNIKNAYYEKYKISLYQKVSQNVSIMRSYHKTLFALIKT